MQIPPDLKFMGAVKTEHLADESLVTGPDAVVCHPKMWVIETISSEGVAVVADGVEIACRPRLWYVFAPGVKYHYKYTHASRRRSAMWVTLTMAAVPPPLARRTVFVVEDLACRIEERVARLCDLAYMGEPGNGHLLYGESVALVGEVIAAAHGEGRGTVAAPWRTFPCGHNTQTLLSRVDDYVLSHLDETPRLPDIATGLSMSVSSLAHRFRQETGWTVIARVQWLKVREAKRRFLEPDVSIGEVSVSLGFASLSYFSRVFSLHTGMSPRAYKRSVGKGG